MPDEFSPAHNIVCSGCSVWHRSVEEKLSWYENQPDQSNCQGGLHTMLDRSPVRSSRAGPLPGLPGRAASGAPGAPGPGRERGSRAGPRAGLPGRRAASGAPGPQGRGAPGPRTGDTRGSYLAPGRCARRVPLTSGDIRNFLVQ